MTKPSPSLRIGRRPPAIEERRRSGVRRDLHVVAARHQVGPRPRCGERRPTGVLELGGEQGGDERLRRGVGRVEDDEPVRAEHLFEHPRERLRDAHARGVGAREDVLQPGRELGGGERRDERRDRLLDAPRPAERADRVGAGPLGRGGLDRAARGIRVEHRGRPHLVPVVILRVDPEDRHRAHAVLPLDAGSEPDRGDRLEQREERAAEEPRLLARHNRDGARVGERGCRLDRLGRRAPAGLLRAQHRRHRLARPGVLPRRRNGAGPGAGVGRVAREERRERGGIHGVVDREAPQPRKAAGVHGQPQGAL